MKRKGSSTGCSRRESNMCQIAIDAAHLLGARPKIDGERRKSAPQMVSISGDQKGSLLNVVDDDGLAPLPYITTRGHSFSCSPFTSHWSTPRGSPNRSPWMSPWHSPRSRSRAASRELQLEELVVVSVPCREKKIENVRLLDRFNSKNPSTGTLYLTATHLIFVDPEAKKETWILHMHVSVVEKLPLSTQGSPLSVRCKNFLTVTFVIPRERDCHDLFVSLTQLSQPVSMEDLYCFHYTSSVDEIDKAEGWDLYDPIKEFDRMGVSQSSWVNTTLNSEYEICDTYPRELFVPEDASTKVIFSSSRFRSRGRFPVLTYLHKNQAALCRCSQPLSGFSARCLEDEELLKCILKCNPGANHMVVVDTRPKINAMANRAAGKGYENEAFYGNIKFHFYGIENIHVMRSSLAKLIETCQVVAPTMSGFLSGVESSGWLRHVRCVIETSVFIASTLARSITVLVHCSDGWDRTAQTCALAQVILDPFYRTLRGFQILIEKEWLSFGHKFSDRCGHVQGDSKEQAPIFTQFVDCVWQLSRMFPSAFEFNERFLLVLHDHVYSVQFGTFVGNCQKDRVDLRLKDRTFSFWGYIKVHEREFKNPLYRKDSTPDVLKPNVLPQCIRFWAGMYNRFENGIHPREPVFDTLASTLEHSTSLEDHSEFLLKRISWLKDEIRKRRASLEDNRNSDGNNFDLVSIKNRLQNGNVVNSGSHSLLSMRNVEESLQSAGALSGGPSPCDVLAHPLLTETSPEKLTIEIKGENQKNENGWKQPRGFISPATPYGLASSMSLLCLDWRSFRNIRECSCTTPFDNYSRKYHCWMCGEVFCTRCIDKRSALPGHLGKELVPVCRPCYKNVTRSLSVDTP